MTDESHWNEWQLFQGYAICSCAEIADFERRATALGITAWEAAIFESIWYGHGQVSSKDLLADRAFGRYEARNPSKAIQAIDRCFADELIQFLTADFLLAMKTELDAEGYLQPGGLVGAADNDMDAVGLEPVLKRLKDREQAPELPEAEMEVSVVFPASGEASEMLQPGECPLDFPSVSVIETVPLREVSQRLVFPFDERTDQTDA